jgi:hypothetical protein
MTLLDLNFLFVLVGVYGMDEVSALGLFLEYDLGL